MRSLVLALTATAALAFASPAFADPPGRHRGNRGHRPGFRGHHGQFYRGSHRGHYHGHHGHYRRPVGGPGWTYLNPRYRYWPRYAPYAPYRGYPYRYASPGVSFGVYRPGVWFQFGYRR